MKRPCPGTGPGSEPLSAQGVLGFVSRVRQSVQTWEGDGLASDLCEALSEESVAVADDFERGTLQEFFKSIAEKFLQPRAPRPAQVALWLTEGGYTPRCRCEAEPHRRILLADISNGVAGS